MLTWRDFEGESISLSLPHSRFMALPGRGLSASGCCWGEPKFGEEHASSFTRASSLSICARFRAHSTGRKALMPQGSFPSLLSTVYELKDHAKTQLSQLSLRLQDRAAVSITTI